ncbi:MAG TPA: DUF4129 domain-containing protein [Gaiellaceae bacterium]|nr:DUF4129 domain-containing protein [Gaiellaceae bacterium]
MTRRRLIALGLVVTALLAVVAIAAHGRPLGKGSGSSGGLPVSFWSWVFTTLVILLLFLAGAGLFAVFAFRRERAEVESYQRRTLRSLAVLIGVAVFVFILGRHLNLHKLFHPNGTTTHNRSGSGAGAHGAHIAKPQHVQFRWEELVVVLVLLLALAAVAWQARRQLGSGSRTRRVSPEVLAAALDESLDDLRADPDLRRAIIAAYARMEAALAAAGVPRDPAEAPFEYLERALLALDTSAAAVHRLTDLFEWARFSQHEPEPAMRDEAVDALIAVRDELRASELTPA